MHRTLLSFFLYVFVFATGASGLIFQVTWQKYVSRLLGSDSVATAIILGTFLGGLSLGYYLCGKLSTRLRNHFKAYAVLQGIIGIWCLTFPSIFQAVDSLTRTWSFAPPVLLLLQGVLCAALLMGIPTICMGGTIPLLTRGISRNVAEATTIHATVYAINTAGAFVGTLLAGFYLIPTHGLPLTIMGASFLNVGALLFFYALSAVMRPVDVTRKQDETPPGVVPPEGQPSSAGIPAVVLYSLVFLSGFYVMTLENVLIRIVNLSVGSSSYSFSLIVAVFILAIALGSSVVGRLRRIPRTLLFFNQLGITLLLLLVYISLDTWPYWAHLVRIAFQANIVGFWGYYCGVFGALGAVLLLPVACMGATIPLAFHELKRDLQHVGTHSGLLFSWNTLGNLSGSLIGGIVLYYFLNHARVFLLAVVLAACSTWLAGWALDRKYTVLAGILVVVSVGGMLLTPFYRQEHFMFGTFKIREPLTYSLVGPTEFFKRFNQGGKLHFYKDGPTTTVGVVESSKYPAFAQRPMSIMVNGKSDSNTIGDTYTLKLLAHIPALLAESRKNILVIGLGTGVTAGELTLYPDVECIDVAEISPVVVEVFPYFREFTYDAHANPRVQIHIGDAFRILGRSEKKWDLIISEPSNPWVTGVDLLFTEQFYKLARKHLTENGILVQWAHLRAASPLMIGMILNTVQQEFSQSRVFIANSDDLITIASNTRFSHENLQHAEEILEMNQAVRASLEAISLNSLESILLREIWTPTYITDHFADSGIQTMDNPRLHYIAGKSFFIGENASEGYRSVSVSYLQEYLMLQRHKNWKNFPFSKKAFERLLLSTRNKVHGGFFSMAPALKLKAYLSDPALFPLSVQERQEFEVDLLPFITQPVPYEEAWSLVGLEGASFRQKGQALLQHIRTHRNWIVPYPVAGLQTILETGMSQGRDPYEKNWCALQLVLLLAQEHHDMAEARAVLARLIRGEDGTILLNRQDRSLLHEVNRLIYMLERKS